jgi:SAM-dependent methyltransferase
MLGGNGIDVVPVDSFTTTFWMGSMTNKDYRCRVCRCESSSKRYSVREMMLGTREAFDYQECDHCGSLQIVDIPDMETLSRHYPPNYYSYNVPDSKSSAGLRRRVKLWLRQQRDKAALGSGNVLGWGLNAIKPRSSVINILSSAGVRPQQRILDVGCGAGALLDQLADLGFSKLMGADPLIPGDVRTRRGVEIKKLRLSEVADKFDVIMFHHSFEHVPWPEQELRSARNRLDAGRLCIIRIPTPTSEAWDVYRTDWVQLDAPRHLTLISRSGMEILAANCGFVLSSTIDDSTDFGLIGSEAYRRDIPLFPLVDAKWKPLFSPDQVAAYKARAQQLNAEHRGDQAAFLLQAVA